MVQVTTMLDELLKIFPRDDVEKLEKQYRSSHFTKYFTGWQQLTSPSLDEKSFKKGSSKHNVQQS